MNIVSELLERRRQRKALAEEKNRLLHDRISRIFNDERTTAQSESVETTEQEDCQPVAVGKA